MDRVTTGHDRQKKRPDTRQTKSKVENVASFSVAVVVRCQRFKSSTRWETIYYIVFSKMAKFTIEDDSPVFWVENHCHNNMSRNTQYRLRRTHHHSLSNLNKRNDEQNGLVHGAAAHRYQSGEQTSIRERYWLSSRSFPFICFHKKIISNFQFNWVHIRHPVP